MSTVYNGPFDRVTFSLVSKEISVHLEGDIVATAALDTADGVRTLKDTGNGNIVIATGEPSGVTPDYKLQAVFGAQGVIEFKNNLEMANGDNVFGVKIGTDDMRNGRSDYHSYNLQDENVHLRWENDVLYVHTFY